MMAGFDVAVVGLGAMGSAALYAAAKSGLRAIGFDRFEPGHDRGSSQGESRIIRLAYYEDPAYVPLLRGAYRAWRALEAATNKRVMTITGIIEAGIPGAALIAGSLRSVREHQLPHEILTPHEANRRFPALSLPDDWDCLFQPDGGVLLPEKAIRLFVAAARARGAEARVNCPVRQVAPKGDHVRVTLQDGSVIEAASAIIATGPWISDLLPELGRQLALTRQPLLWFQPRDAALVKPDRLPVFFFQSEDALTYGLPDIAGHGVKAGSHYSGGTLGSADEEREAVSDAEKSALSALLARYMPAAAGPVTRTSVCVYSRTQDEHFVLGPHPETPQIVMASPCSGHGFKFASIIGEILVELACQRSTAWPIALFDPRRLATP